MRSVVLEGTLYDSNRKLDPGDNAELMIPPPLLHVDDQVDLTFRGDGSRRTGTIRSVMGGYRYLVSVEDE